MTTCITITYKNNITRNLCFKYGMGELQDFIYDFLPHDQISRNIHISTNGKSKLTNYLDFIKLFVNEVKIYATKKSLHHWDNDNSILKTPKQLKELGFKI